VSNQHVDGTIGHIKFVSQSCGSGVASRQRRPLPVYAHVNIILRSAFETVGTRSTLVKTLTKNPGGCSTFRISPCFKPGTDP